MGGVLEVVTSTLETLAGGHDKTVGQIKAATAEANGLNTTVRTTHGTYTNDFNDALDSFISTRSQAGNGIADVATQLAQNLISAVTSYLTTDSMGADILKKIFAS